MTAAGGLWRPYVDEPLFVPALIAGPGRLDAADADRLSAYLAALVEHRGVVHTAVAFNAVYFGYDLEFGGYIGGPVDFDAFPTVVFGQTTAALPVGAMVNIATSATPLCAEIVYKEGAHPALVADGDLPAWLSGAPAGARGPGVAADPGGHPVLSERLVADFDAFGANLTATRAQLDRLRGRGRWLDSLGHLLLDARYPGAEAAEASDRDFFIRYLLTVGREQLLAGPLPLLLPDGADEQQLAAALTAALATLADTLAGISSVRSFGEYAFSRARLATRLRDDGPLGGADLGSLAAGIGRAAPSAPRRALAAPATAVRYTAVGPLLRTVRDAAPHLIGPRYAEAVCHLNTVIGDDARRESDEHGALPSGAHLRLDDAWQGGGVWRASLPAGPYASADPLVPYGLGWLDSLPVAALEEQQQDPEVPGAAGPQLLMVSDSHLTWAVTLRLSHLLASTVPVPPRVGEEVEAAGLLGARMRLMLGHDGCDLDAAEATQDVTCTRVGSGLHLSGVIWPLEFFAGIVLTFTWQRGALTLRAVSTLADAPVVIDGVQYDHRYDPAVLTRDSAPGSPRRAGAGGPLTLRARVLRAVRTVGRLDAAGAAALPETRLVDLVYGPYAGPGGAAALRPVVQVLLADGTLTLEHADIVGAAFRWPATSGGGVIPVLVWRPRPAPGVPRPQRPAAGGTVSDPSADSLEASVNGYLVTDFLRLLPTNRRASEEMKAEYRARMARYGRVAELPDGYTLVREHTRSRRQR